MVHGIRMAPWAFEAMTNVQCSWIHAPGEGQLHAWLHATKFSTCAHTCTKFSSSTTY
jgi:hypothetical protein